jgi:hypothetical protein
MTLQDDTMQHFVHRENIARYQRILRTCLTADERRFVKRRLLEEQSAVEQVAVRIRPISESAYVIR